MSENDITPWLITVDEAAKLLNVSRSHLYKMIARREIPHVRFGRDTGDQERSSVRINPTTLREWLQHLEESSMPNLVSELAVNQLTSTLRLK
jgi:excisionase family DNA binding protein